MAHSTHRRWKGHCLMCAAGRIRGNGRAKKDPFRVLRELGRKRRTRRGFIPPDD